MLGCTNIWNMSCQHWSNTFSNTGKITSDWYSIDMLLKSQCFCWGRWSLMKVGWPPVFHFKITDGWSVHVTRGVCGLSLPRQSQSEGTALSRGRQKHYYDSKRWISCCHSSCKACGQRASSDVVATIQEQQSSWWVSTLVEEHIYSLAAVSPLGQ